MLVYILFIIGFGILIKGADLLVSGASSFAKKLKIPTIVIGLTIVAFGTSMPELIVNIFASAKGQVDLALGNVIGSNISNILLLFFAVFLYYVFAISQSSDVKDDLNVKKYKYWQDGMLMIVGIVGLFVGGRWIGEGASALAHAFGMAEALIGLTIVAVGTSLPELATSAVAAYKKQADIAVGNIVGSNIFNIFWILGVSAIIRPLPFSPALNFDVLIMLVATLLLFASMFIGQRHKLERWQGIVFVGLYVLYIVALVQRG